MKDLSAIAVLVVILLTFISCVQDADTVATISGTVTYLGAPVADRDVYLVAGGFASNLETPRRISRIRTKTSSSGDFLFTIVEPGTYHVDLKVWQPYRPTVSFDSQWKTGIESHFA